ncbi:hypothetical protein SDIAM26S_00977 [Streptomyces diastaticus subsp. diastaticus]
MQSNLIQSKVMTVEEVFTGRQYRLDTYQREFTWGRSDVRRLIDDLRKKFSANWRLEHDRTRVARYQPYFLGPYVYHEEDRTTYLVDGQQRITTLHLMLIYLRELLRAQDLEDEAGLAHEPHQKPEVRALRAHPGHSGPFGVPGRGLHREGILPSR